MSPDPSGRDRNDGVPPPASFGNRVSRDGQAPGMDRLPPPAFPPGSRRIAVRRAERHRDQGAEGGAGIPSDAFISPDDPITAIDTATGDASTAASEPGVEDHGVGTEAFISPDEPLPSRTGGSGSPEALDTADAVVTGIDDDPHLEEEEGRAGRGVAFDDPHIAVLAERVGRLSDALRERGEAGLRTAPGMSRFEATLRAYCVGWLAARREGSEDG